jgi:subtilisin family serine protease
MWRYILSFTLLAACGLLLFANQQRNGEPRMYNKQETAQKHLLVAQDLQVTDELCRTQCSMDFRQAVLRVQGKDNGQIKAELEAMRSKHTHMDKLIWSAHTQPLEEGIGVGEVDSAVVPAVTTYLKTAKETVKKGQSYQSPQIKKGEEAYFVLGVPSADGQASLVGVVHQDILAKVADHQRKNLRLEPFPAEFHPKIESVDAETMRDKNITHPDDHAGTSHIHQNEVVVRFNGHPTDSELQQIKREIGASSFQKLGYTYVFRADKMEAKELISYFKKWNVAYVEPHYFYMTNQTDATGGDASDNIDTSGIAPIVPNDSLFSRYQWNLPITDTTKGWQVTKGDRAVPVAVIDTGVDFGHSDLQGNLQQGFNVINQDQQPADDVGHGTHVAGIISALVNNGLGVAGMTWYNPIIPVKALDSSGSGSTYSVAQGIIWATDHGAKVINMSLGNYADANFLHDAVKYAFDHDVVLIAASGNDNTERPGYPAAYPEVFAVAATDARNNKAPFSNYGDYIDVAAPGVSIASTYPHNQYAALSGTSMACPHVTALAALIRSANPLLKNTEVMDIIRQTAKDLGDPGKDKYFGYGLIDVVKAVQAADKSKYSVTYWPQWVSRKLEAIAQKYAAS